ncbi:MAG: DUF6531 domain-containing protein, partial [Chloroflexales bacterium]|nr:DUF6531 domain-containing protein [Chloroflexales bacterium]
MSRWLRQLTLLTLVTMLVSLLPPLPLSATTVPSTAFDPSTAGLAPITTNPTQLELVVSNANPFAEEHISVTVTARDAAGNVDPSYRGVVKFSSTSAFVGLPTRKYTFTAADAGIHTWTNVRIRQSGDHTLTVTDNTLTTSVDLTIKPVQLVLTPSVNEVFAEEEFAGVTVRVEDQAGNLLPAYRGKVSFKSDSRFVGLPVGGLGGNPYTFTAADAGTRTWTKVRLRQAGHKTITVTDGYRQAAVPVTVKPVVLKLTVTPDTVFPGQPEITATLKIQDTEGNLVPGYRGAVTFRSDSKFKGLPVGGLGGIPYGFTAADAGQHSWGKVSVSTPGTQVLTATDSFRTGESNPILVDHLDFRITFSSPQSFMNDRTLSMTVEVIDQNGNLVPAYRGSVNLNPSVPTIGLPQSILSTPDYTFTEQDAGRHVFEQVAFTAQGNHTVTVVDRGNSAINETSAPVAVTVPLDPQPVSPAPAPLVVSLPPSLALPAPMPYSWGQPFVAEAVREPANYWHGKPAYPVPAQEGTLYIMTGSSRRSLGAWWAGTAYVCPKMGWESILRSDRREGGGLRPGTDDPTFMTGPKAIGIKMCGPWSSNSNNGQIVHLTPTLSTPAPAGAQGVHVNPESRGNVSGDYSLAFNDASGDLECDGAQESPLVGDPIDVRSGTFYLEEPDIGVATGCANMSLRFVRTYRYGAPSTGSLGPGWTHNFETRVITTKNDYVMVQRPRGSLLVFQDVGGDVYASRADSSWTLLKRSAGGWILAHRDRRAEAYDAQGRLIALQDANGNQMWMTYETVTRNGATTTRLARVDAPGGRFLWFGYDYYRPGRIIVVGDNADRRMRFGYDDTKAYDFVDNGVLVSATDATGAVSTYTYATNSWRMLKKTDALGRDVFVNEYDASGRVIRQQLNTGQDLRLSYTVITDTAEIQNRLGAAEAQGLHALLETTVQDQAGSASYTFGSDGLLRLMTDPAGATTRYQQYTAARKPGVIVDALGRTTRMAYNERGQVISITDALSQTTQIEYDSWGLPTRLAGQGQIYDIQYDGPRLIEVRDQNGQHISFGYSDQAGWKNALTSMQHSGSLTTTLTLNTAGDVTELRDALGRSTRLQYDAAGRLTQHTDQRGRVTTLTYDAADRVI